MNNPSPRFTGIFIPVEVLEMENLTLFEMMLLSWIDALYCTKHGGCFASNQYLGSKIGNAKENTVAKALTHLRNLGLIENVSFDGRTRVIRALISRHVEKSQSKSGLDKNPIGVGQKSNAECDKNPSSPYIENKEDNKDKNIAQTATQLRQNTPDISFSFDKKKFEHVKDDDLKSWKELYPDIDIVRELRRMVEWCLSNPSKAKSKKKWRKFITTWLQNEYEKATNKAAIRSQRQMNIIDDHKVNEKYWGGKPAAGAGKRKVLDCTEDV